MKAQTFTDILKFNPYHDSRGRFASANGAASFTYSPGKSTAHDNAIAREKERQAAGGSAEEKKELTPDDKDWVNTKQQSNHPYIDRAYNNKDVERVANATETDEKTAAQMIDAVDKFTGNGYKHIRQAQMDARNGDSYDEIDKGIADDLESFIQRSPKWAGGNLHRGISVSQEEAADLIKKVQSGETLDMKGTSSWTSEVKVATDFALLSITDRVGVVFHTNSKTTQNGTSIKHLSEMKYEKEVIVSERARYRGTRIVNNSGNNRVDIYLDEV